MLETLKDFMLRLMVAAKAESGQTLVEYGLIIVLVSVALIAGLTALNVDIGAVFTKIGNTLNPA